MWFQVRHQRENWIEFFSGAEKNCISWDHLGLLYTQKHQMVMLFLNIYKDIAVQIILFRVFYCFHLQRFFSSLHWLIQYNQHSFLLDLWLAYFFMLQTIPEKNKVFPSAETKWISVYSMDTSIYGFPRLFQGMLINLTNYLAVSPFLMHMHWVNEQSLERPMAPLEYEMDNLHVCFISFIRKDPV